jgi:hypothetical protein
MNKLDQLRIDNLIAELIKFQQTKLLQSGRQIIPNLTDDDLLQPNDFNQLEHHPLFRYEEGLLAGIQTVQMAIRALARDLEGDDNHT